MEFTSTNSYISISQEAGDDLEKILASCSYGGQSDKERRFQDIRKILVSALSDAEEKTAERELHCLFTTKIKGESVGVYCVVQSGAPDGILKYTVQVVGIVKENRVGLFINTKRFLHTVYERLNKNVRK